MKTSSSPVGVLVRLSRQEEGPCSPLVGRAAVSPGRCPDSAGQVFQTQTSQTLTMCCCGNGGQPRREVGASGEPAQGALRPPAPLPLGGVRTVPTRLRDAPLQSRGCLWPPGSRLGWPWGLPGLSAGHVACSTPGSRSGCVWDTLRLTPPPRGILALPRGCQLATLPPPSLQLREVGGPGPCVSCDIHWVSSEGSNTCARGGLQRGPPRPLQ